MRTGLGLWRLRYLTEWLRRDAPDLGLYTAWRKHWNLLKSWNAPQQLPAITAMPTADAAPLFLLSGEFHWHLTAFCLTSLFQQTTAFRPYLLDDGTLREGQREELMRIVPFLTIISADESEHQVYEHLPQNRFPSLHIMRRQLGLMRKLVDVHVGKTGRTLFVDSDVFFYRRPAYLEQWNHLGEYPLYILDYQTAYGYDPKTLQDVYGEGLKPRVNSGLTGIDSNTIDWHKLEFWAQKLLAAEPVNHFSEQALTAMLMTELGGVAAPPERYVVSPDRAEILAPRAEMHHYVVPSRTWYYIDAIPIFLKTTARPK